MIKHKARTQRLAKIRESDKNKWKETIGKRYVPRTARCLPSPAETPKRKSRNVVKMLMADSDAENQAANSGEAMWQKRDNRRIRALLQEHTH